MSLADQVQQWRPMVAQVLDDLRQLEPDKMAILPALGLSETAAEDLVLAVIQKESSGNAATPDGDNGDSVGLMQINYRVNANNPDVMNYPTTAYGDLQFEFVATKDDLRDPFVNIACGTRYLVMWLNKFHDVNTAVLAYNGPEDAQAYYDSGGNAQEAGNFPYLSAVLSYLGVGMDYFSTLTDKKKTWWTVGGILTAGLLYLVYRRRRKGGAG